MTTIRITTLASLAVAAACAGSQPPPAEPRPVEQPTAELPAGPRMQHYELAYPTGDRATSTLLVEKIVPEEVRAGERYSYTIHVTNLSDQPLANVVIDETASGIEIQPPSRPGARPAKPGRWMIQRLEPGATKTFQATAIAKQVGTRSSCLTVDYTPRLCTEVDVVNPELALTKTGPRRAYACDELAYTYSISNTGSGTARDVEIYEPLPEGLTTADGKREVLIRVGDLSAGQTARRTVRLRAGHTGTFESRAMARSGTDQTTSDVVATTVVQPELAVTVTGPDWQYIDEPITYTVTVKNVSDVPARDTRLQLQANAPLDRPEQALGTLAPGETRRIEVTLPGTGEQAQLSATTRSTCAAPTTDRIATQIRGVPALRVGTVDTADPVNVGDTTTYIVTVRNQGSAPARDVEVTAELPEGMTLVDVQGPAPARQEGGQLVIGPLQLPPEKTAEWRVEMRAEEPGTQRFRTEVSSAFLDRPVPDVEPTRVIEPR